MRRKDFEKEQRVKAAVIKLILEEGFEGASISKIARAAGVSPATVYIYYDNKEQMLSSIYREYANSTYEYLMDRIRADMDGSAPWCGAITATSPTIRRSTASWSSVPTVPLSPPRSTTTCAAPLTFSTA